MRKEGLIEFEKEMDVRRVLSVVEKQKNTLKY
jgi:hypothetical protein